jgi:hypothetical protein
VWGWVRATLLGNDSGRVCFYLLRVWCTDQIQKPDSRQFLMALTKQQFYLVEPVNIYTRSFFRVLTFLVATFIQVLIGLLFRPMPLRIMVWLTGAAIVVFVAMETSLLLTQTRTHKISFQCCPFASLQTELDATLSFQTSVKTEESNSLSNHMPLSPSWEATSCSVTQELPNILWNPTVLNRVHKTPTGRYSQRD